MLFLTIDAIQMNTADVRLFMCALCVHYLSSRNHYPNIWFQFILSCLFEKRCKQEKKEEIDTEINKESDNDLTQITSKKSRQIHLFCSNCNKNKCVFNFPKFLVNPEERERNFVFKIFGKGPQIFFPWCVNRWRKTGINTQHLKKSYYHSICSKLQSHFILATTNHK